MNHCTAIIQWKGSVWSGLGLEGFGGDLVLVGCWIEWVWRWSGLEGFGLEGFGGVLIWRGFGLNGFGWLLVWMGFSLKVIDLEVLGELIGWRKDGWRKERWTGERCCDQAMIITCCFQKHSS